MGLNNLTGSPWHIESFHREDGEERRHRSRCMYYDKINKRCDYHNSVCYGSAHCDNYKEMPKDETLKREKISKPDSTIKTHKKRSAPILVQEGSSVFNKKYGPGIVKSYLHEGTQIVICFDGEDVKFTFPDAFVKGFLTLK